MVNDEDDISFVLTMGVDNSYPTGSVVALTEYSTYSTVMLKLLVDGRIVKYLASGNTRVAVELSVAVNVICVPLKFSVIKEVPGSAIPSGKELIVYDKVLAPV